MNSRLISLTIQGDVEAVGELLEASADPATLLTAQDPAGNCAGHYACLYNESDLVAKFASFSLGWAETRNKRGMTPLHFASYSDSCGAAKALLDRSAVTLDAPNQWRETPLHLACAANAVECVALLVSRGASLTACDQWDQTALEVARTHGQQAVVNQLSGGAVRTGAAAVVEKDVGAPPPTSSENLSKKMEFPLREAQFFEWLADASVDVNGRDFFGLTALHKLAAWNKARCLLALLRHERLLPATVGRTGGDDRGTFLHHAVTMQSLQCLEALAEASILPSHFVNATDGNQRAPLDLLPASDDDQKGGDDHAADVNQRMRAVLISCGALQKKERP